MKHLAKNPFFYLSVVLVIALAFEVATLVRAQYAGPTAPPTGGQPYAPLDTSSFPQTKAGDLTITGSVNAGSVNAADALTGVGLTKSGIILFGPSSGAVAGIRFNAIDNIMEYTTSSPANDKWVEFGAGAGGGIFGEYDVDLKGGIPFTVKGGSNSPGILLKNTRGGTRAPSLVWDSSSPLIHGATFEMTLDGSIFRFGPLSISSTQIPTQSFYISSEEKIIDTGKEIEKNDYGKDLNSLLGTYWDSKYRDSRMECDSSAARNECDVNLSYPPNTSTKDIVYDLFVESWKKQDYNGSCPDDPLSATTGDLKANCGYRVKVAEFNKTASTQMMYELEATACYGEGHYNDQEAFNKYSSYKSLSCDKSFAKECAQTVFVSQANAPQFGKDAFMAGQYVACVNAYRLKSVSDNAPVIGGLAVDEVKAKIVEMRPSIPQSSFTGWLDGQFLRWGTTASPDDRCKVDADRGKLFFFKDTRVEDRMCQCRKHDNRGIGLVCW